MAVKNSRISMYADDTFVSIETKSKLDIREELYPEFIKICEWLKANILSLNFLKKYWNIKKAGEHSPSTFSDKVI